MLRVEVEPSGEGFWKLDPIVDLINQGAVGVIPTDTVYVLLHLASCQLAFFRMKKIR
jgi:tRNA A37 threonylcarbamoyladenosine synthetase subunit TsaC/SUA5/YrdC